MASSFSVLNSVLDNGYYGSRFGICCPDCEYEENKSLHFLGNVDRFLLMNELAPCTITGCCFNIFATVESYQQFAEAVGNEFLDSLEVESIDEVILAVTSGETACLDNNFYSCITQISGLCDDFSVFVESGIVELNTLSGQSAICTLKDYIIDNSLSTSDAQELLQIFFGTKGMATFCVEDNISISSVETFGQYGESVGIVCDQVPPPA